MMRTQPGSGTWKWRRPTSGGVAILGALAAMEAVFVFLNFLPSLSDSDYNWAFGISSLLVGWLLVICAIIFLTEKT
jgi:hypothetical protein